MQVINEVKVAKAKVASIERGENEIFVFFLEPVQIGSQKMLFVEYKSNIDFNLFDIPIDSKEINVYWGYQIFMGSLKTITVIGLEKIL